jgi:3-methyladenine DNA glycosylase Mpg
LYCISIPKATPIATNISQRFPQSFFARPAEQVAPELIGSLLVKR